MTPNPERDVIQIVLALYDPSGKYSRHAGVVMTSLFEHTSSRVRVTVLHDATLTADNRQRFCRTAARWGQEVRFIDVSEAILGMGSDLDKFAGQFSRGTLFRLLIPAMVDCAKVIYLDCDIAVNLDVAELWNVDIENHSLAAVPDGAVIDWGRKLHYKVRAWAMRYEKNRYFNAGVLLMNLDRIRRKQCDFVREAKKFFERYRLCNDFADQEFLNVLFRGEVRLIDGRFNNILDRCHIDGAILHFTKDYRPWAVHLCEPRDYFYWETFSRSEWRDQIVDAALEMYKSNGYSHLHTSDCYRRIWGRWKKDIVLNNALVQLFKDIAVCVREFGYRFSENRERGCESGVRSLRIDE